MWQVTLDVMQELKEDLLFRCMYVTDSGSRAAVDLELADCPGCLVSLWQRRGARVHRCRRWPGRATGLGWSGCLYFIEKASATWTKGVQRFRFESSPPAQSAIEARSLSNIDPVLHALGSSHGPFHFVLARLVVARLKLS